MGDANFNSIQESAFSVLDLCPIRLGGSPAESLQNSLDLARHAENWGYQRYWVAEHHNMPGIASSATSVVIGFIAGGTSSIRVGSGGIMLPNHSPLVIAEQFGTLECLYPGRIDLGLGRAPGTDQVTARALRRTPEQYGEDFPELLGELLYYFQPEDGQGSKSMHAVPGEGLKIPIWLLGSSDFSARLAAQMGLPFAFASHFSPSYTLSALKVYRDQFRPSEVLKQPYVMIGINAVVSGTDEEAQFLASSMQQQVLSLLRGRPSQLKPPMENVESLCTEYEKQALKERRRYTIVGSSETALLQLQKIKEETHADEFIFSSQIYEHQARLHSYEIISGFFK